MILFWLDSSATVWSDGMVRRMSISLRAPMVVVKLPLSPPSSAVVRIWISRSLVVNCNDAAGLADQHIGQDGQGMPALHDAGHRLQNRQHFFLRCFQYDHVNLFFNLYRFN